MNVPWNASWSAEERFEVRPCRWAGGKLALWQPHKPQEGKPIFAKPHTVRQRRSIAENRCTVCGEKTPPEDRYWFGIGEETRHGGFRTTESPVHRRCADLALEQCPRLRGMGRKPQRMEPPHDVLLAVIFGEAVKRDFGLDLRAPVVGHLKLAWRYDPRPIEWIADARSTGPFVRVTMEEL